MKIIFYLSMICFSCTGWAIKGKVWEKGTKKPLADINIFLLPEQSKSISDQNGGYDLPTTAMENCQIVVNVTGYLKFEKNLKCDQEILDIYLEKITYNSYETIIISKSTKRDAQSQGLSQEEFISMPGSFGGDPVRATQNLPGVSQSGAGAEIIIQGASPQDTGYLINGHRVPLVFHFGGLTSVLIPQAVERVDLLPSGYGPEYSRAIGGIINLQTKDPKTDRHHGLAYVDLLTAGTLFEGPLSEKSSYLAAARYSYIGYVFKEIAKSNDDFNISTAPTSADVLGIYRYQFNQQWTFKNTFIASRDNLELILNKGIQDDPQLRGDFQNTTEFFRFIPQLIGKIDEKTSTEHSLAIGQDKILVNINGRYLNVDANVLSHRSELTRIWSEQHKTFFGLDNEFSLSNVKVNLPNSYDLGGVRNPFGVGDERKFLSKGREADLGAYLRHEYQPVLQGPLTLLPNVRVDYFSITQESFVQPRFQARYQVNPSLEFHSAYGHYVQPPQPQESSPDYGNKEIRSPRAIHYMAGWSRDFRQNGTEGLTFTNNYFYKTLDSLVIPSLNENYNNEGTGKILGAEIQAKYQKGTWSGQLVYTYLNSKRSIPGSGEYPAEFDQSNNLNLIAAKQYERWAFSGRFRLVSGLPYTPISNSVYDADNDVYIPIRGSLYSSRYSTFHQLDLRVERKTIYDQWILSWYIDVQNILNAKNSSSVDYSYDYSQQSTSRGLPILPSFGVKGEF